MQSGGCWRRFPQRRWCRSSATSRGRSRCPRISSSPKLGFFPGSTIGNFLPADACRVARQHAGRALGRRGGSWSASTLKKDPRALLPAYNDEAGVTAAFNLNLLARINRELDGHSISTASATKPSTTPRGAHRNAHRQPSRLTQVSGAASFRFEAGETIHTENSYKYSIRQFQELARTAGWMPGRVWLDDGNLFSVHELIAGLR